MNNKTPKTGSPELDDTKSNLIGKEAMSEATKNAVNKIKSSASNVIKISSQTSSHSEAKDELIISLSNVYEFDHKSYSEIDLRGLRDMNAEDAIRLEKMFYGEGNMAPINEMSTPYTLMVASVASELPLELFKKLKINDAVKIKNTVSGFLLQ